MLRRLRQKETADAEATAKEFAAFPKSKGSAAANLAPEKMRGAVL